MDTKTMAARGLLREIWKLAEADGDEHMQALIEGVAALVDAGPVRPDWALPTPPPPDSGEEEYEVKFYFDEDSGWLWGGEGWSPAYDQMQANLCRFFDLISGVE